MPKTKKAVEERRVRVRMYNVGFGDAFLLRFPSEDGERRVLIDCGVHPTGKDKKHPMKNVVAQIVRDVTDGDGPRIDVVIATHRHADHVSGFSEKAWNDVSVGEVWMPWTEDPVDPDARRIRETQSKVAKRLAAAFAADQAVGALAANALSNAAAMETLHHGFRGVKRRRFLPPKQKSRATFTPDVLPGVTVDVMGPSRDPEVIRDMDPPAHHSYLRRAAQADEEMAAGQKLQPFRPQWSVGAADYAAAWPYLSVPGRTMGLLKNLAEEDAFAVASALESSVNGTSLMLMFRVGEAKLLFPGDAQWGTWNAAIGDPRWRDLLEQTTFYKVGHHGSHNATPTDFVEDVLRSSSSLQAAMICTKANTNHWDIPRMPLLTKLGGKTKNIVRSDTADDTPKAFKRDGANDFVDYEVEV